ncbi:MAG: ubiquinone/menaquinone biosynthesis methyltransferase, partial [Nitrospinota bacterium]
NRLLSAGIDRKWRRRAVRELSPNGGLYLDVAAGTGDMAIEIARQSSGAKVVATDFSLEMLAIGARKTAGKPVMHGQGDALELAFRENSFDGITCAFGIRNFHDLNKGLTEMVRVLKPGGRTAILEFATPENRLIRKLYLPYFHKILPLVGSFISGNRSAYNYLPDSVKEFPKGKDLAAILEDAGFIDVSVTELSFGICDLITARKPIS